MQHVSIKIRPVEKQKVRDQEKRLELKQLQLLLNLMSASEDFIIITLEAYNSLLNLLLST